MVVAYTNTDFFKILIQRQGSIFDNVFLKLVITFIISMAAASTAASRRPRARAHTCSTGLAPRGTALHAAAVRALPAAVCASWRPSANRTPDRTLSTSSHDRLLSVAAQLHVHRPNPSLCVPCVAVMGP